MFHFKIRQEKSANPEYLALSSPIQVPSVLLPSSASVFLETTATDVILDKGKDISVAIGYGNDRGKQPIRSVTPISLMLLAIDAIGERQATLSVNETADITEFVHSDAIVAQEGVPVKYMETIASFRSKFLASWRTRGAVGSEPLRRDWPPHLGAGDPSDPHPTRHEERLCAIACVNRADPRAGAVAKRRDFLGLGRKRTCALLGISEATMARRREHFWAALQAHMCGDGCEGCSEACRRP